MTLKEYENKRRDVYEEYYEILEGYYNTCKKTRSLNRALSAYRNYITFAEVTGMKNRMIAYEVCIDGMEHCIENLAQNKE